MSHDPADPAHSDWRLRVAEYALGLLPEADASEVARHLADGCPECAQELRIAREVEASLLATAPSVPPPPSLRDRLLAIVRAKPARDGSGERVLQSWRSWAPLTAATDGRALVRAGEGAWEETAIEGISVRRLAVDEPAKRVTMMVRMAPGTRYPPHRHGGLEECYVLEGDLRHRDDVLRAGDFERMETGAVHDWQWTEGGCLLLIHSSQVDEVLE